VSRDVRSLRGSHTESSCDHRLILEGVSSRLYDVVCVIMTENVVSDVDRGHDVAARFETRADFFQRPALNF
jgi:hypothetical protein